MPTLIRNAVPADAARLQEIYAHYVLHGLASFEVTPPDEAEMAARMARVKERGHPYLVAESDGEISGYAYASTYRHRPAYDHTLENSVYVSPDHLGQGIGSQLLSELVDVCEGLGVRQLIAVIGDSENHASINLHSKCGFTRVGLLPSTGYKHEQWVDSVLMQRAIGEGDSTPPN